MISDYIKKLRNELGLTQESVADRLEISRQTYSALESGKKDITLNEAKALAKLFNVNLGDFINSRDTAFIVSLQEEDLGKEENEISYRDSTPQITVDATKVDKFKQMFLYILDKVGAKSNVGETVIYKLLYFVDFDYYEKFEEQLIGATYVKNHYGPTPLEFKKIVEAMILKNEVEKVSSTYFSFPQTKYLPIAKPNLSVFTGREIKHIDDVLDRLASKNATELTDLSHKDVPWVTATEGNQLSYEAVFYRTDDTSVRQYNDGDL
jgi:transcriptional regulator with XRE-family HTH domain